MDAKKLNLKNSSELSSMHGDDEEYTSDDEIYSDEMMSDNEYDESCTGNKSSKRLKSYQNTGDDAFRNRSKLSSNGSKASIKRMPTRKPDPKISNRNAIMARENRRKKKEHMEVLQKTVDDTQNENKKLRKMLSIRNNTIAKLTHESLYLRSILANKTEIMSLLRCFQKNRTPITSSGLSFVADNEYQPKAAAPSIRRSSKSSSGCSPASSSMSPSSYAEDDKENDLENGSHTDCAATESISSYEQSTDDFRWENLLNDPSTFQSDSSPLADISDLRDIDDSEFLSTNNSVKIEHNYFNNPITNKVAEKSDNAPGICLHVSSGRVSLEFCATCHLNSQNAWCEEM